MEKLDENYLDLVRESLYKKQSNLSSKPSTTKFKNSNKLQGKIVANVDSPKNVVKEGFKNKKETFKAKAKLQKKLKRNSKLEPVTLIDLTSNKPHSRSTRGSDSKVDDRVSTQFKTVNVNIDPDISEQQDCEILNTMAKQPSPHLKENDQLITYPAGQNCYDLSEVVKKNNNVKSKKRLLTKWDSPNSMEKLDLVRENLYKKQFKLSSKHSDTKSKNLNNKLKYKIGGNDVSPTNKIHEGFKTKKEILKAQDKVEKKVKKKTKQKQVTFIDNKPESCSTPHSRTNVENRVSTPFKTSKTSKLPDFNKQDCKIVSTIAKHLSPSLNEEDRFIINYSTDQDYHYDLSKVIKKDNIVKSKKRLLSETDSPKVSLKRKKTYFAPKGNRLLFDNSSDDSELCKIENGSTNIGQKKKITSKKKKYKHKSLQWDECLDTNLILDTSLDVTSKPNLNNTMENFTFSPTNEKKKEKTMKLRKKIKSKVLKTIVNVSKNETRQKINNINLDNSCKTSPFVQEEPSTSKASVDKTIISSIKKSDYNDEMQSKKVKKLKIKKKTLKASKSRERNDTGVDSSSNSDVEFKPKYKFIENIEKDAVDLSDTSDNETVGVKGLKFQRFCDLFPPTCNEQFIGQTNVLNIPKKYFQMSENDLEPDWLSKKDSGLKNRKGSRSEGKKKSSTSSIFKHLDITNKIEKRTEHPILEIEQTSQLDGKTSQLDSTEIKSVQKENIYILNMQVLQSANNLKDQKFTQEKIDIPRTDSTENLNDSINLNQMSEAIENEGSSEISSRPVIVTLKNGNKIIVLHFGEKIHFRGLCSIKVLYGEIEILGGSLNSTSEEKKIYSPRGSALLYVSNNAVLNTESLVKLKDLVSEEFLHSEDVELAFEQHHAIFLCRELKEAYIDFIENYISQKIFPESLGLRVDFKLQGIWNKMCSSEQWNEELENIPEDSKTVISGGKGVGKSTFLRYAVNFLLRTFKKIRVIDLDPGQSEFYSPGCISVVTVDKYIFGPNYTHILKPDSLLLSHINMGYDIQKYLKSVKYLLESTKYMTVLPTLINFPGFTQGLGQNISAHLLSMVHPNLVIQINSKSSSKNYRIDLTAGNVNHTLKEKSTLNQDDFSDAVDLAYNFVKFDSLAENNEAWSLEARQAREMNILSYFGQIMSESVRDLTSPDVNMYSITISAISITNAEGKEISHVAVNANLVALCSVLDEGSNIFSCYGYGFVRGMDLQTDTLVLITPESIETLANVSHLVLSSVTTPPSLIMTASGVRGHIPYISVGELVDFGQFTKRSYLPPRK